MKNTTEVPNEVIIDAHKEACQKWKTIIEGIAPELFKPMFKVGDWVNWKGCNEAIGRINRLACSKDCYVLDVFGAKESSYTSCHINHLSLATPSEIESHLIKEAEKRGYKEGVIVHCSNIYPDQTSYNSKLLNEWSYIHCSDLLQCSSDCGGRTIYCRGKWATIISEPLELTLDEIAKKFGVDAVKIKK